MLVLAGGYVIGHEVPVDVVVDGDRIHSVGAPAPPGTRTVDCAGATVVPGNVCGHTHLYSALAAGMPAPPRVPASFRDVLELVWWPLDRALDASTVAASARLGALEAVRCGTTSLVDHHASGRFVEGSLDLVADALAEVGVRGIVCYETSDREGPDAAARGIAENIRFGKENTRPLLSAMIGAHAGVTLSDASLDALAVAVETTGAGLHIHVAEDRWDADAPARLDAAGLVSAGNLFAHCVHVDESAAARMRDAGVTVAHNARSNANNRVGDAEPRRLGTVVLGTDGIGADMWAETQAAFLGDRRRHGDGASYELAKTWLDAGADFVGGRFGGGLGAVTPGALADLSVVDWGTPGGPGHWLFGPGAAGVRHVLIAGEVVYEDRRFTRLDEAEVRAHAREAAPRLWARMEDFR